MARYLLNRLLSDRKETQSKNNNNTMDHNHIKMFDNNYISRSYKYIQRLHNHTHFSQRPTKNLKCD